jgi:poly(A) polymerase
MREDPVRILRAIKFVTRLNLTLDPELAAAMAECHEDLVRSAPPRVFEELLRMLGGPLPGRAIQLLGRLGILWLLVPELNLRPNAEGEDERMQRIVQRLNVLGELDRGLRSFSTPLYYATLLYDEAVRRVAEHDRDSSVPLEEFLRPFAMRARLSRRDTARLRAMFQALKRIDPQLAPRRTKRRRRVAMQEFVRRDFFEEALTLFRIVVTAEGRDEQALHHWEERFDERDKHLPAGEDREHEERPRGPDSAPRKHRRRRRSRSR